MFFIFLSRIFAIEISIEPCVGVSLRCLQGIVLFLKLNIMINLEQLVEELDINQIDEVVGGWDPTTVGPSSVGDWTWTTNKWGNYDYFKSFSEKNGETN